MRVMREWSFSASAEYAVGLMLVLVLAVMMFA
jgi:hypothetical protein